MREHIEIFGQKRSFIVKLEFLLQITDFHIQVEILLFQRLDAVLQRSHVDFVLFSVLLGL